MVGPVHNWSNHIKIKHFGTPSSFEWRKHMFFFFFGFFWWGGTLMGGERFLSAFYMTVRCRWPSGERHCTVMQMLRNFGLPWARQGVSHPFGGALFVWPSQIPGSPHPVPPPTKESRFLATMGNGKTAASWGEGKRNCKNSPWVRVFWIWVLIGWVLALSLTDRKMTKKWWKWKGTSMEASLSPSLFLPICHFALICIIFLVDSKRLYCRTPETWFGGEFSVKWFGFRPKSELQAKSRSYGPKVRVTAWQTPESEQNRPEKGPEWGLGVSTENHLKAFLNAPKLSCVNLWSVGCDFV